MTEWFCKRSLRRVSAILAPAIWSMLLPACAQSSADTAAWQTAAGGKTAFEVASIHADQGPFRSPSFPLSADDSFREPNGRFHADFTLITYIEFAYKIWPNGEDQRRMVSGWPGWITSERYDIEATAPLHATKDQYRLMMQDLLATRFGLKVHFEQREMPVVAMTLTHPGITGPRLIPHSKGLPCDEKPKEDTFPTVCYTYAVTPSKNGLYIAGSRATTMNAIGDFLGSIGGASGQIGRRVVDQTGLTGQWDFTLEAVPPNQSLSDTENTGPTMLEAVHDQLGLTLKPARAVVPVLVIDKMERPSEN